jgi:hypothetical protein
MKEKTDLIEFHALVIKAAIIDYLVIMMILCKIFVNNRHSLLLINTLYVH